MKTLPPPEVTTRWQCDRTAAVLSLVPGAGQLYKGHYAEGATLLAAGIFSLAWLVTLTALGWALWLVLGLAAPLPRALRLVLTAIPLAAGFLPALAFWLCEIAEAWLEPDWRHPAPADEPR